MSSGSYMRTGQNEMIKVTLNSGDIWDIFVPQTGQLLFREMIPY